MSVVSTGGNTANIPDTSYNYSNGFIFKRGELRWIVLFNRQAPLKIAINFYNGTGWIGWVEK